jgi:hypothetical protein
MQRQLLDPVRVRQQSAPPDVVNPALEDRFP